MMTTNLFVIANVKQLRTGGSFRIILSFFNVLGCWPPKFTILNSFHNRVEFGTILEGLRNFGGLNPPNPPPLGTPLVRDSADCSDDCEVARHIGYNGPKRVVFVTERAVRSYVRTYLMSESTTANQCAWCCNKQCSFQ